MKDLVVIGAGGQGREVLQLISDINNSQPTWNMLGFLDEDKTIHGKLVNGQKVLGNLSWLKNRAEVFVIIAIGSSLHRKNVCEKIIGFQHQNFATLIHPKAYVGSTVTVGAGSIVAFGVCMTANISISSHVLINYNSTIGHDCKLNEFVTIGPASNLSGNTLVGAGSEIGANTVTIPSIKIGDWSVVGAGSVIISEVPSHVTVVGSPARIVKKRN